MAKTSRPSRVKAQVNRRGRKKAAPAGSGRAKRGGKKPTGVSSRGSAVRDLEAGDIESYLRLRQAFDSFQAMTLYYYGTGENTQQRTERAEEVKAHLNSFIRRGTIILGPDQDCPPGMKSCPGGGCIPEYDLCYPPDDGT